MDAARVLHDTIKPAAIMLVFIYFMIAVVDKLSGENFTWEQLWRQMGLLLAAYYLMQHGFEILELLFNIGMAVAAQISNAFGTDISQPSVDAEEMIKNFQDNWGINGFSIKIIDNIVMFIYLLIPWLFSWIMRLCVSVICYSRVIEIYARATFAPIAIADFFHSGLQSGGWRFLKNFLAVSLQGAMILVIAILYSRLFNMITTTDTNLFTFVGKFLAFYAAAVMLMFKSLSLTKELVGTN